MKSGWKTVKLGEAAKIISGRNQREVESPNGPYPIIGSGGEMGRANETLCPADTTVIGRKGSINRPFFMSEPFWNVDTAFGISADRGVITPRFLHYFCLSFDFTTLNKGTTIPSLVKSDIAEILIPLPPLAEQKRIVALLDEAFAGIDAAKAKAEASIQSLGTLVVSEFQSLVDDKRFERKLLPELASHTLGKMLDKKKNTGTPRPYLRNVNVRWFDFDLSDIHEMPIRDEEAARCQARKGDVLMCEGGYPGRCAIWSSVEPVFFQKALHRIRFNDKWMAEWFVNYMHSLDSSGKISEFFTGTGIQHLTGETLSKLTIPVPPKSEIETYVKKISTIRDKTNELAANESAKVNALCELKASLLTQAFAGELTA